MSASLTEQDIRPVELMAKQRKGLGFFEYIASH